MLRKKGKATQHNRKTKQHNTTHPRQLFFNKKSCLTCIFSLSYVARILVSGIYMYVCIHMYIYLVPNFSAAVRVGLIDGKFHLNPTAREVQFCYHILCSECHKASFFQLDSSCLNLIVTTTEDNFGKLALSFVPRNFRRGQEWERG